MTQASEETQRKQAYLDSIRALKIALDSAWRFPEYPENNVIIVELTEVIDNIKTRISAMASNGDKKELKERLEQFEVIFHNTRRGHEN